MTEKKFPDGFYWGAATSAFQVEGGIRNMDWEEAAVKGLVPALGRSADHYNLYEEDFDLIKALGHNAHRFSIEWARIEPEEGKFDLQEIEHYRQVLLALRARGIEPFITLWHFTLPLWFSKKGGFEQDGSGEIFARYCSFVVSRLADLCHNFSTINEPNVYASHGWLYGAWPPFKRGKFLWIKFGKADGTWKSAQTLSFKNILRYFKVTNNLVKAHNAAYVSIKKVAPQVDVSIVKHVRAFDANWNPLYRLLAVIAAYYQSGKFMKGISGHFDSIGLNYYRYTKFGDTEIYPTTDMGWKVNPEKIELALKYLSRYKKPIYISEAGVADDTDSLRVDYIKRQVQGVWNAIQSGVDVRGHMYWSLLDNYELALGYDKRFGLIEVDYETLERKIRPSAYVYKEICEKNAVIE
ncbi:MAG TPA: family 1 glycosylhydrolase [Candidatus Paceibacterota bacterium]|nr:family 1 glycosylhydrolase [Candidatus Paceibacterota bacterium]